MTRYARQRGVGFLGLLFWAVVLGFVVLIGLKVIPIYMESFKIDTALKNLIHDPQINQMSNRAIISSLRKRFDIDEVQNITDTNIDKHVKITRDNGRVTIIVTYQARAPLFSNLTLLANFRKEVHD